MFGQHYFQFKMWQMSGGSSKIHNGTVVSSSFRWTVSAVAGWNSKVPIEILADAELSVVSF